EQPWMPPALEFQPESAELVALAADAPVEMPAAPGAPEGGEGRAIASAAEVQLAKVLAGPTRPTLSVITRGTAAQVNSWSGQPTRLLDAKRFAELRALIESLVHTFLESYGAESQPALAAVPMAGVVPGLPGGVPLAAPDSTQPATQGGGANAALQWQ